MHLESGCVGSFWWPEEYPPQIHELPRPNAERELLYEEERVVRTMARCTSGTVRELALLDGVTHSARSPVCLIKHHAGCWGVRVLVTERAVCVAVVVVRAACLVLRNQLESRQGRPCSGAPTFVLRIDESLGSAGGPIPSLIYIHSPIGDSLCVTP